MATIRPSVYVGLGGTGILAIAQAKKLFEDAYGKGNIPGEIAFAAIDFDLTAPDSTALATDVHDDFLQLYNAASPRQTYEGGINRGDYRWMFEPNAAFIGDRISDGASQVRTYGRFLTEMIQSEIMRRLRECIGQVKNIQNTNPDVAQIPTIDVHIAMSLAGGTGCGSFLNVAQLIRNEYGTEVNIIGYGVIHGVFRAMDVTGNKTPRVVANAYSAIVDLDYLMSASLNNPIEISLNGNNQELTHPIYDEFYIIDNETERGDRVNHVKKLSEVVGTCLFAASTDLGTKVRSGSSNTGWKNGQYDISPKRGWVQSLGACQVVYKGDVLAEVYGLKAALSLIHSLQSTDVDANALAISWASDEAKIVEHEADQLIDSIYDIKKEGVPSLTTLDPKDSVSDVRATVDAYTGKLPNFPSLTAGIKDLLRKKINALLSKSCGVGNALAFSDALRINLNIYRNEMDTERGVYDAQATEAKTAMEAEFKEYEDYCNNFITTRRRKLEYLEGIGQLANVILRNRIESARREAASLVFTDLIIEVDSIKSSLELLSNKLSSIKTVTNEALSQKQLCSESSLVFEYDLSEKERITMEFSPEKSFLDDYLASIGKPMLEIDVENELANGIYDYCSKLPAAQAYRDRLIVDVIRDLGDSDYDKLKYEIEKKSSRLLRLEDRGQVMPTNQNALPTTKIVQNYFIYLYQKEGEQNRLEQDGTFFRYVGRDNKEYIHSNFDSMKQKIIFYRSDMAIIPYCICAFSDMVVNREYAPVVKDSRTTGSTSFNPHFDKQLFEHMRAVDFKLKPEMKNEAEFYWVCGQFFGWKEIPEQQYIMEKEKGKPVRIETKVDVSHPKYICCDKGKYVFWNNSGKATISGDKWQPLGNTTQREKAFNYFKTVVLPEHKNEYHDLILNVLRTQGVQKFVLMIQEVISEGMPDYIDKVACTDKNSLTYSAKQNGETDRFVEEWAYIENELINALQNFK